MTLYIVLGAAVYAAVSLFIARYSYGVGRAAAIDKRVHDAKHAPAARSLLYRAPKNPVGDAVDHFNRHERGNMMLGAVCLGLVWPATVLVVGVGRFLDSTPQQSRSELAARAAAVETPGDAATALRSEERT